MGIGQDSRAESAGLAAAGAGIGVGRSVERGCAFVDGWGEAGGSAAAEGFGNAGWDGGRALLGRQAEERDEVVAARRGDVGFAGASLGLIFAEEGLPSARLQDSAEVAASCS